jgi:ORF6N domain
MNSPRRTTPTPPRILDARGVKVVLDEDLARLYGVSTARLNQAVKRNARRFPQDFAFHLSEAECRILRSQFVISSSDHGGRRTRPWAFTEHGAIMTATVLNSSRAIEMSIFVVRAFLRLRDLTASHRELAVKLAKLERKVTHHDEELKTIISALRKLIVPPIQQRRAIGFSR